jgi:hypothetical protein
MFGLDSAASTDTENITTNIMANITLILIRSLLLDRIKHHYRYIETISVQAKVVISYDPESNLMLFKTCDFLPIPKVKASQFPLHISYFLQKCKKGKPSKKNLPYLKTISQVLNPLLRFWIHSSNMQFSPKNWDG